MNMQHLDLALTLIGALFVAFFSLVAFDAIRHVLRKRRDAKRSSLRGFAASEGARISWVCR